MKSSARSSPSAGASTPRHSSVIAAMNAAGESVQLAMTIAEIFGGQIDFESDLQPGRHVRGAVREVDARGAVRGVRRDPRRAVHGRRTRAPGVPMDRSGHRQVGVLRRERTLAEAVLPPLAAAVRAPRHVRVLAQPASTPSTAPIARTSASTTGRPRASAVVAVASGTVVSAGWSGGGGNMVRLRHASGFESYYLHLSRFGSGIRARRARRAGADHRPRRRDGNRDRSAPGLPAQEKRRVRESR